MSVQRDAYNKVYNNDPEERPGSDESLHAYQLPLVHKSRRIVSILSHISAVFLGIIVCFVALQWQEYRYQKTRTDVKLHRSSMIPAELTQYSEMVRYNGTLQFPSIYRGAGVEVDNAWSDLTDTVGFLNLDATEEDIKELGADPETLARFPEKDGGGYVMTLEYTHQLHCLDLLRRVNPWNYPEFQMAQLELHKTSKGHHREETFKTHVDHCTEMLRQILMCHADTTPIFEQWVSVRDHPWPNFNTVHQCRNFEAIHLWAKKHVKSLDTKWPTRPKHAKALANPP